MHKKNLLDDTITCDVFIVGAGPTGLMLAIELARANVSFVIIDAKKSVSEIIKATAISSNALETFDDLGFAEPFVQKGIFTHALNIYIEGQAKLHLPWTGIESKYSSYCLLGQNYVEKFQEELLGKFSKKVQWETHLVDFKQNESVITGNIEYNGRNRPFNCRYLIGCDGSKSTVRELAQIPLKGKSYPNHYVIADVHLSGNFSRKDWYFFMARKGFCSIGPLPDNRWGVLMTLPAGKADTVHKTPDLQTLQTLFDIRCDISGKLSQPKWISHFHTYLKYVKNRQKGRVFLCGDAAHQISPLTSLGMNSGILDARNLAWKLALVCQGHASPDLLDSYNKEQQQTLKIAQLLSNTNERSFNMIGAFSREIRDHLTELFLNFPPVMRMFGGILSQTNISFKKSSIIDEFIGLPLHLPISKHHLSSQTSCMKAWADFGKGLIPGSYAPDVDGVTRTGDVKSKWLFDKLPGGKHALLLFTGKTIPTIERLTNLRSIANFVKVQYSDWIRIYFIVAGKEIPETIDWDGHILLDKQRMVHERYGATADCLYLIRPDRFIGYRSLPPRQDKLEKYLTKIFKKEF